MALYIKANPLVARFLGLENERIQSPDGNYILWQADMLAFGSLVQIQETALQIGAVLMAPLAARQEQDGEVCHAMPVAEDPRFIMPEQVEEIAEEIIEKVIEEAEQPQEEAEA